MTIYATDISTLTMHGRIESYLPLQINVVDCILIPYKNSDSA